MEILEKKEEKDCTLGEAMNFNQLFRVKGHKGLFFPVSAKTKNNLVGLKSFTGGKSVTANTANLVCLGNLIFKTSGGDKITVTEAFDNLNFYSVSDIKMLSDEGLLNTICPDYDPCEFKIYHAKQFAEWVIEIKQKVI